MNGEERRKQHKILDESKQDISFGSKVDLPLSVEQLQNIENYPEYIIESFVGGLTAKVYHLRINNKDYNLKVKRPEALVKNEDGKYSFLNEILCRIKIRENTTSIFESQIIKSIYASYKEGIMLSEWIEGELFNTYNETTFKNLYNLLFELEKIGLFEWDLCSGNLLSKNNQVFMFDFGYMYEFDILKEINSEGMLSVFHMVERFETRSFMPYLLDLELEKGYDTAFELYQEEKKSAIWIYKNKINYLIEKNGEQDVIDFLEELIRKWSNEELLHEIYALERFRSYILDIHDDISGKSCTKHTLLKIEKVIQIIEDNHEFNVRNNAYLWDDAGLDKKTLIEKYHQNLQLAKHYQIGAKDA